MRNLVLTAQTGALLRQLPGGVALESTLNTQDGISAITTDSASGRTFCISGGGTFYVIENATFAVLWSQDLPSCKASDSWFCATYLSESDSVFVADTSGQLMVIELKSRQIEEIGQLDNGLAAAVWSTDQELVALATRGGSLLVMTSSWDVLAEVPFEIPEEDSSVNICWRSDGQYIALTSTDASTGIRKMRVWTQDLTLHGVGRHEDNTTVENLCSSCAWSTNGSLIGVPQQVRDQLQISFFERNGLRHGEVVLRGVDPERVQVEDLGWNAESDLLAVALRPKLDEDTSELWSVVQLWSRGNYHWYCKQTLTFGRLPDWLQLDADCSVTPGHREHISPALVNTLMWDAELPYRLRVGGLMSPSEPFCVQFDVTWSSTVSNGNSCTAAVVDGCQLLLTPLRHALVPPPMSHAKLQFQEPLQDISFEPHSVPTPDNRILPVDGDARVAVLTCSGQMGIVATALNPPRSEAARCGDIFQRCTDTSCAYDPDHPKYTDELLQQTGNSDVLKSALWAGMSNKLIDLSNLIAQYELENDLSEHKLSSSISSWLRCLTWTSCSFNTTSNGTFTAEYKFVVVKSQLSHNKIGSKNTIVEVKVSIMSTPNSDVSTQIAEILKMTPVIGDESILSICCDTSQRDRLFVQLSDGSIYPYWLQSKCNDAQSCGFGQLETKFPQPCPVMTMIPDTDSVEHTIPVIASEPQVSDTTEEQTEDDDNLSVAAASTVSEVPSQHTNSASTSPTAMLIGFASSAGRLFCRDQLISPSCSSFVIHTQTGEGLAPGTTLQHSHTSLDVNYGSATATFNRQATLLYVTLGPIPNLCVASRQTLTALMRVAENDSGKQPGTANATTDQQVLRDYFAFDQGALRSLERGARLVAAVRDQTNVVLQMPRGNLEGIHPRTLILTRARFLLDSREYGAALELMRKHRVDLNLIYDHDPAAFEAFAPLAVKQVKRHDRWDLFLSATENDDVVTSSYPLAPFYVRPGIKVAGSEDIDANTHLSTTLTSKTATSKETKRNRVCHIFREAVWNTYPVLQQVCEAKSVSLAQSDIPWTLLLSVLTSYARQVPPQLEQALRTVQHLGSLEAAQANVHSHSDEESDDDTATPVDRHAIGISAEKALSHLLLLANVDLLFDVALGMYDLDLVALVAQRSQKDPKEYVPFLLRLRRLASQDALHAHLAIDLHLKRWNSALSSAAALLHAQLSADQTKKHELDSHFTENMRQHLEIAAPKTFSHETEVDAAIQNPFDTCCQLIAGYQLHQQGCELFPRSKYPVMYTFCATQWGRSLEREARAEETRPVKYNEKPVSPAFITQLRNNAIAAFLSCVPPAYTEAIDVCTEHPEKQPGWRRAIGIASAAGQNKADLSVLAMRLAVNLRKLESTSAWRDAAQLFHTYCDDMETAAMVLCGIKENTEVEFENKSLLGAIEGLYDEAIALCTQQGRKDIISSVVMPAIEGATRGLIDSFHSRVPKLEEILKKLATCRELRLKMPLHELLGVTQEELEEQKVRDGDDASTVWSDADSVAGSVLSGVSGLSSHSGLTDISSLSSMSLRSESTTLTQRQSGRFSNISALELASNPFSHASHGLDQQEAELNKREKRRLKKQQHNKARRDRHKRRPGSKQQQAHYEEQVAALLPSETTYREAEGLCSCLLILGRSNLASELRSALNNMIGRMAQLPTLPARISLPSRNAALAQATEGLDINNADGTIMIAPYVGGKPRAVPLSLLVDTNAATDQPNEHDKNADVDHQLQLLREQSAVKNMLPSLEFLC